MANAPRFFGMDPERIYSIDEICDLWKLTRRWVLDNWVKPRAIAFTRCGDAVFITGRNLKRWVEDNQTDAEPALE